MILGEIEPPAARRDVRGLVDRLFGPSLSIGASKRLVGLSVVALATMRSYTERSKVLKLRVVAERRRPFLSSVCLVC